MDTPELSFRFDAGVCMPSSTVNINKKSDIIQALLTHYFVHVIRSELEQLKNGLSMLGVLDLLHSHPSLLKPLFLAGGKPHMTCDHIIKLFCVCWCPSGSNRREVEESVILGWTEYIHKSQSFLVGLNTFMESKVIVVWVI